MRILSVRSTFACSFLFGFGLASQPLAAQSTVLAVSDSYVKSGTPNQTQGGSTILRIQDSGNNRAMVQFDQTAIAAAVGSQNLALAKLRLYIVANGNNWGSTGRIVDAHRLTKTWTEAGATWNCPADTNAANSSPDCSPVWNMGSYLEWPFVQMATATALHGNGQTGWVEWDVTEDVRKFLANTATNYGWLVRKDNEGQSGQVDYSSKEGANAPQLVLTMGGTPPPPADPALTPSKDTFLTSGSANQNQGTASYMRIQQPGSNRALVQFAQSGIASTVGNGQLLSAKLRLFVLTNANNWGTAGRNVNVHRLTSDWTELGATWNCPNDTIPSNSQPNCTPTWEMTQSAQWPFATTATATALHQNDQTGWVEWDVTSDVAAFLAGSQPNYGWIVRKADESQAGEVVYAAREGNLPPTLVLQVSNPPPPPNAVVSSVTPSSGNAGQVLTVTIVGTDTAFAAGTTQANFGAGVAVGGSPVGEFGPITVISPTQGTASLQIVSNAGAGERDVVVQTGTQTATKTGGFTVTVPVPADAPVYSPSGGAFTSPLTVSISSTTAGAAIYYTADGTTPTTASSQYSGPIGVNANTTLQAIAVKDGYSNSAISTAVYTIQAALPIITPGGKTSTSPVTVSINAPTPGTAIHYTIDGSTPSTAVGSMYSGPITISTTTTLKAIAFSNAYVDSQVATAVYSIVAPPQITNVTPVTGAAGTQVTVSGSGFGAERGTGRLWLGTNPGTIVSWGDTQITATVSPGSTSGTVQVQQAWASSNSATFTVSTATITTVSPGSGLPGTQVTIAGSGFGATQGAGQVWLGTASATVQSWSDTQVVAVVAAGSASGKAQVLQGGVWSNALVFAVNTPHITSVSPTSGVPGTSVTISGSGFGSVQGSGSVQLGNLAGQVVTWTDTQVVAVVATGSLTGIARIQQNAVLSNARAFKVQDANGNTITLSPNLLNLAVGDSHRIQALNGTLQPVTGLTWASSDPAIVSLSSSDPPELSALAVGHVTITAGTGSADVTVYPGELPVGTVIWSSPGDGSDTSVSGMILPAVPSVRGVADVFGIQNGLIQALTTDGITAWTADQSQFWDDNSFGTSFNGWALPDFQGGLVLAGWGGGDNDVIKKLDGLTGAMVATYTAGAERCICGVVPHPDGTIFAVEQPWDPDATGDVVGIDSATGAEKFRVAGVGRFWADMIIAGDGNAYLPYGDYGDGDDTSLTVKLLRVNSSGAFAKIDIFDCSASCGSFRGVFPITDRSIPALMTNADDGVFLSWQGWPVGEDLPLKRLTKVSSTGVTSVSGPAIAGQEQEPVVPILVREDGTLVGVAYVGPYTSPLQDLTPYMVAFDPSGAVLWSVANEIPEMATQDGTVITRSGAVYGSGDALGQGGNAPLLSWRGNDYGGQRSPTSVVPSPTLPARTLWAQAGGNPSKSSIGRRPWFFILNWSNDYTFFSPPPINIRSPDVSSQATIIKLTALAALKKAYLGWPVTVREGAANTGDNRALIQNTSGAVGACGLTTNVLLRTSWVGFDCVGTQAQKALGIHPQNAEEMAIASQRRDLMESIGRGVGAIAAHEIAHQFLNKCCGMDLYTHEDSNAAATYNNASEDGDPSEQNIDSEPATYTGYGKDGTLIHWQNITRNVLNLCLSRGWTDYGLRTCSATYF